MPDLDAETEVRLAMQGISPRGAKPRPLDNAPATLSGIPGLLGYDLPALARTNTAGLVLRKQSPGEADRMYLAPDAGMDTVAHEAEHLMAQRGLGSGSALNTQFDKLIGNPKARDVFVRSAIDAAPYLQEKYGLKNAYFDPKMYSFQGSAAPNLLYEQLASLASVEATQNVDLTKDPVLRKTLFKDKDVRETYNALVGLRQTRLDPRDIPPHTRIPEKEDAGLASKVKKLIGLAEGGQVAQAGRNKLI